jgi:hypothetical protein
MKGLGCGYQLAAAVLKKSGPRHEEASLTKLLRLHHSLTAPFGRWASAIFPQRGPRNMTSNFDRTKQWIRK